MIYHVQARFRADTAAEFLAKLTDGTISGQRPDGAELVASMQRAVVNSRGLIPNPIDQNLCAHFRIPMDMMVQG